MCTYVRTELPAGEPFVWQTDRFCVRARAAAQHCHNPREEWLTLIPRTHEGYISREESENIR